MGNEKTPQQVLNSEKRYRDFTAYTVLVGLGAVAGLSIKSGVEIAQGNFAQGAESLGWGVAISVATVADLAAFSRAQDRYEAVGGEPVRNAK